MRKNLVSLSIFLTIFLLPNFQRPVLAAGPYAFKILVDVNQINVEESEQASRFAADGVWSIPINSPRGIDWTKLYETLNGDAWTISEDNPNSTRSVDLVSAKLGRKVDAVMAYNEGQIQSVISDEQITMYSSHVIPGYGTVGNRIVILSRNYSDGSKDPEDPHGRPGFNYKVFVDHALADPRVSGVAFEVTLIGQLNVPNMVDGCLHALQLGKKCYILAPPNERGGPLPSFLENFQQGVRWLPESLLKSPNFYIVPAVYIRRDTGGHFVSTGPDDKNSIEAIVKWLKLFRGSAPPTPTPPPIPGDLTPLGDTPGNQVNVNDYNVLKVNFGKTGTAGWIPADINGNGKVDIFDYNILVENFGK